MESSLNFKLIVLGAQSKNTLIKVLEKVVLS